MKTKSTKKQIAETEMKLTWARRLWLRAIRAGRTEMDKEYKAQAQSFAMLIMLMESE